MPEVKGIGEPVSRLQQLVVDGQEPDFPELSGGAYLVEHLWDVGPVLSGGMGAVPLTHEELRAWQSNTGIELQPWEARLLKNLSQDYLAESHRAEKSDCPPPYQPEQMLQQNREAVAQKVRNAMNAYRMAKEQP